MAVLLETPGASGADGAAARRVTVTVYVSVVVPSWAVPRIWMVLLPSLSASDPDAEPDATDANSPLPTRTAIVAFAWLFVGVTVIEAVAFETIAV